MKKLILLTVFVSFSLFAGLLTPQLQKESVFIGEEFEIKVETSPSETMSAKFTNESKDLAITGVYASEDGKALNIKLITLKSGELKAPDIELTLGGKTVTLESFGIISNNRTQENDTNLRDIKEPVKIFEKDYLILYVLLFLVLAAVLFYLFIKLKKRFKKKLAEAVKIVDPSKVAAQFIKEAKEKRESGDNEAFVDLSTFGLKTYMSLISLINYKEMTTYEVKRKIRKDIRFSTFSDRIVEIFNLGDRFKFADDLLSENDLDKLIYGFSEIVKETEKEKVKDNDVA